MLHLQFRPGQAHDAGIRNWHRFMMSSRLQLEIIAFNCQGLAQAGRASNRTSYASSSLSSPPLSALVYWPIDKQSEWQREIWISFEIESNENINKDILSPLQVRSLSLSFSPAIPYIGCSLSLDCFILRANCFCWGYPAKRDLFEGKLSCIKVS